MRNILTVHFYKKKHILVILTSRATRICGQWSFSFKGGGYIRVSPSKFIVKIKKKTHNRTFKMVFYKLIPFYRYDCY